MPNVQMPDGTVVAMPDQLTPELGARLRNFYDSTAAKKAGISVDDYRQMQDLHNPNPSSTGDRLLGAADAGAHALSAGTVGFGLGGAYSLLSRIKALFTGEDPNAAAAAAHQSVDKNLVYQPQTEIGKSLTEAPGALLHGAAQQATAASPTLAKVDQATSAALSNPTVQTVLGTTGDVAGTTGLGGMAAKGIGAAQDLAAFRAANPKVGEAVGFRTPDAHPLAQTLAGGSGQQAFHIHNGKVGNTLASTEAGLLPGQEIARNTLEAARAGPNSVYERAAENVPPGRLSPAAQALVDRAGGNEAGLIQTGSKDADAAIASMRSQLQGQEFTGPQVVANLRKLRQEGYRRIATDTPDDQHIGRAQLDMANALEQHIADSLQPGATTSLEQLKTARTALAKSFAVEEAAKGGADIDLAAIGRMQQMDPELLTGGLKEIADFANRNPTLVGRASDIYQKPGYLGDVGHDVRGLVGVVPKIMDFLGGRAGARRILTGDTGAAVAKARAAYPGAPKGLFDELAPDTSFRMQAQTPSTPFAPHQLGRVPEPPPPTPNGGPPGIYEPHQPQLDLFTELGGPPQHGLFPGAPSRTAPGPSIEAERPGVTPIARPPSAPAAGEPPMPGLFPGEPGRQSLGQEIAPAAPSASAVDQKAALDHLMQVLAALKRSGKLPDGP